MKTSDAFLIGLAAMWSAATPAQQTYPPSGYSDQSAYPSGSAQGASPYPTQSPYPAQPAPNSSGQYPAQTPGYDAGSSQPAGSPYPAQTYPTTTDPSTTYPAQTTPQQTYPAQTVYPAQTSYPAQPSYPTQQAYPVQPQTSPLQQTYPGQASYPSQQGWTPPQPVLPPGQAATQPASANCIVKLSTDRSTLHLMNASGANEKKHLSLGSDRVQRVFNSPDGAWSVAVYKVRGAQQFGFIAFELGTCEDQMPVEIPAVATAATFEQAEVVLGFGNGKSQRYPLKNARIQ